MSNTVAGMLIGLLALDLIIALVLLVMYVARQRQQRNAEQAIETELASADTQELIGAPVIVEPERDVMRTPVPMDSVESAQARDALQACIAVLRSVLNGDRETRVVVNVDLTLALSDELSELSYYVNTALDHLMHQLDQTEAAQQEGSAIQRSWADYAKEPDAATGFRYDRDRGVTVDDNVWLPAMSEASQTRHPATRAGELAVPLALGDEIIGALGLQRDVDQPWSNDELLLIQDVVDQLTQTIDRLRLVDDVSRRAALEQTTGAVTASIRSEVEIEGVLQRALAELGRALQADAGSVYLTIDSQQETVQ